jgi:hypothetical protein
VTNTFGGKSARTTDRNFLYFGFYDGGLGLDPRLSNLDVFRLGAQVHPLPDSTGGILPQLLVGAKYNHYTKDASIGAISDPVGFLTSTDVGDGFDVFAGFRPWNDVSTLIQYGHFHPGSAFPIGGNGDTDRFIVSSTLSF